MSPLTVTAAALTAVAAFLWGAAFAGLWPGRPIPAAAGSATVITFLCWERAAARRREDRRAGRREDVHLDTIELLTRPPRRARQPGPFRRDREQ